MPLTLTDLITPQTASTIRARLIARLQAAGVPTADWAPSDAGGVENSRVDMLASALSEILGQRIADIVSGRFVELGERDWLTYYALKFYGIERDPATFTIQNVNFTSVTAAPAYDFGPDEIAVRSDSTGNLYRSIDRLVLPPGKPATIRCRAEFPGSSYQDPEGTVVKMVTAPAGVTCINVAPSQFTPAKVAGNSTGKITGAFESKASGVNPNTPGAGSGTTSASTSTIKPSFKSIRFRIDIFGEVGTGAFSYSIDGGDWQNGGVISSQFVVLQGGVFFFSNGVAPSFVQDDVFTLFVADAILQQGADEESDASLRQRCKFRWSTLSDVATVGEVTLWAQLASPEVDRVSVDADPAQPGGIIVTVASQAGPASPAAVIAVIDYITPRLFYKGVPSAAGFTSPEERVHVVSALSRLITPAGTVDVPRARVSEIQQAAEIAWQSYLRGLPIGGIVRLSELVQAVMDAGAIDFTGAMLNGAAANLQLAANQVPVEAATLLTALAWRPA